MPETPAEDLLRELAPQVLGALVRRYGHFDTAEDAVQEALIAAAHSWPRDGVPENPRGWLITVASRRLTDLLRREQARDAAGGHRGAVGAAGAVARPAADRPPADADDTLILLFLCCHPALSPASQIALTLRAVGGLSTAEVARAFLVPEATMTRRISRGKQRIRDSGLRFAPPTGPERADRLAAVLHVLYLIFTEGYARTAGPGLLRADLTAEAIRLTRLVRRLVPEDPEVTGLLALMLLTDARAPARIGPHGELVPMAEQDRSRWRADQIAEGVELITGALPRGVGRAVPAPGGHRGRARRGAQRGGHRLAADHRPVRGAPRDVRQPGGGAQPRGGGGDEPAARRPGWRCSPTSPTTPDSPTTPTAGRPRPPVGAGG